MINRILTTWIHNPSRIYYGCILLYYVVCFILHGIEASAGGWEQLNNIIVTHQGMGLQRPFRGNMMNLETYQHVRNISAWYESGLHKEGWRYLILQPHPTIKYLPDAIITNNSELISIQLKTARGGQLHWSKMVEYFTQYAPTTDLLQIGCVHNVVYEDITTRLFTHLQTLNAPVPEGVVHHLNMEERFTTEQLKGWEEALTEYKEISSIDEYKGVNKRFQTHMEKGGEVHELFTSSLDEAAHKSAIQSYRESLIKEWKWAQRYPVIK